MTPEIKKESNLAQKSKKKKYYNLLGGAALAAAITFGGNALLPAITTTSAQTASNTPAAATTTTPSAATTTAPAAANSTNPSAATSPSVSPSKPGKPAAGSGKQGPGMKPGRGSEGNGKGSENGHGRGDVSGTISSVSGNTLTLSRDKVIVITATLNSNTVYTMAGKTISQADLKVGTVARVHETFAADGTASISSVEVVLSEADGTIGAITGNSFTLTKTNNSTVKVNTNSSTNFLDLGKTIALADLKAGQKVSASGILNADGSLDAAVINVEHDRLGGVITAISGNNITVQSGHEGGKGGFERGKPGAAPSTPASGTNSSASTAPTKTIVLGSGTAFLQSGQAAQLSDLAVGQRINAEGSLSTDRNSLTALQVNINLPSFHGQVTSVNGSTIVLQDRSGTRTVEVNNATKYLNGTAAASLSDVKTGVNLEVQGKVDAVGKMTALVVQLGKGSEGHGMERD